MCNAPKIAEIQKTNPALFGSGKMIAIVECLLQVPIDNRSTVDKIASICKTSDNVVMGMLDGHIGFNDILGDWGDLSRNVTDLAAHFGAPEEAKSLLANVTIAGVNS